MKEDNSKLKMLVYNDYNQIKSLMKDLSESIEIKKIPEHESNEKMSPAADTEFDVIVFNFAENFSFEWQYVNKIKEINPDIKTIMFTSVKNRKYRRHYLSRGVDYFIFKESEVNLLKSIIMQMHFRKTRIV